jgi:hypothetical protein
MTRFRLIGLCAMMAACALIVSPQVASATAAHTAAATVHAKAAAHAIPADIHHCYVTPGQFCAYTDGGANTPCLVATSSTPVWPSGCINNEDAVDDQFGSGYVRIHYLTDYYGAYACIQAGHYWLNLGGASYDFSYPGEGYQPYGAAAGQYQNIYHNAASDNRANTCS